MTQVVSVRMPASLAGTARSEAERSEMSLSEFLDLLLRCSFDGGDGIRSLEDIPGAWDSKLDVRLSTGTVESLKSLCMTLRLPPGVYIRKLLYHFCITKRVWVVGEANHYKLAVGDD